MGRMGRREPPADVTIGKISTFFQSKTLIPKHKNQIFQKFLTHFPKTSYKRRATRNGYIFVSNVQLRLIIEALALEFTQSLSKACPRCVLTCFSAGGEPPLDSQQGNVSSLAFEFTLGVCLLACLPGVGGLSPARPEGPDS